MKPDQAASLLGRTDIFRELHEDVLLRLAEGSNVRSFKKGRLIFQQGDPGDALYVVVEGLVKVFVVSEDGTEMVLTTMGPSDTLGEIAVLDGRPRSASAQAVEATTTLALARSTFLEVTAAQPAITEAILASLGAVIRRLTEQASDLVFLDLPGRIAKLLLSLAAAEGGDDVVDLRLNQSELAGMVGGTRQSLNRILRSFEGRGLVELSGRTIVIKDPEALRRRAAS
jgi:CRP-like cAMP-binding protein